MKIKGSPGDIGELKCSGPLKVTAVTQIYSLVAMSQCGQAWPLQRRHISCVSVNGSKTEMLIMNFSCYRRTKPNSLWVQTTWGQCLLLASFCNCNLGNLKVFFLIFGWDTNRHCIHIYICITGLFSINGGPNYSSIVMAPHHPPWQWKEPRPLISLRCLVPGQSPALWKWPGWAQPCSRDTKP